MKSHHVRHHHVMTVAIRVRPIVWFFNSNCLEIWRPYVSEPPEEFKINYDTTEDRKLFDFYILLLLGDDDDKAND